MIYGTAPSPWFLRSRFINPAPHPHTKTHIHAYVMPSQYLLPVCSKWLAIRFVLLFTQRLIKASFFSVNRHENTVACSINCTKNNCLHPGLLSNTLSLSNNWLTLILKRTWFGWLIKKQAVKVIWQKAPHGGPIPRLGVTPGGRKLYHWIPGVGFPISKLHFWRTTG